MPTLSIAAALLLLAGCAQPEGRAPVHLEQALEVSTPLDTAEPPEAVLEAVDTGTYAGLDLEIRTYLLPDGPQTPDDSVPRFLMLRPRGVLTEPVAGLIWLHGGVGAVDGDPDFGHLCTLDGIEDMAYATLETRLLANRVAEQGSVILVPVSPWCDLWAGLGPTDPVDPGHASLLHVRQVTRRAIAGVDDLQLDPEALSVWGVSLGGVGAYTVSADLCGRGLCPRALVSDSAPWDLISLYDHPNSSMSQEWLDHFFGGPPLDERGFATSWLDNYQRADTPSLIAGGLEVPSLVTYNRQDLLTDEFHGPAVVDALTDTLPDGPHFTVWDADHRAPGSLYHTQSNLRMPPLVSAMDAAWRFQAGARVRYLEAEDLTLSVGTPLTGEDPELASEVQSCSGEVAIGLTAEEDPGVVLEGALPASLIRDAPLALVLQWLLLDTEEVEDDEVLLTVVLADADGEVLLTHEVLGLHARSARKPEHTVEHMEGATLDLPMGLPEGTVTLTIATEQASTVLVDGLWAAWTEPSP